MTTLAGEALERLALVVQSFLPSTPNPQYRPSVSVSPVRVTPTGLGGFVGMCPEPNGEILGRRVDARVLVTVRAPDLDHLGDAVSSAARALSGAERATLEGQGIFRLDLETIGPPPVDGAPVQRELTFRVLYEYLKLPEESGGVIAAVPLDLETSQTGNQPRALLRAAFDSDPMSWFEAVDDPQATRYRPGRWRHNAPASCIEQVSSIQGGTYAADDPVKPGTYLVLAPSPGRPPVSSFILRARLMSGDVDGIGLVFRWRDADNFYFFLMERRRHYRVMGKKVSGVFQWLDTPAIDPAQGFETDVEYAVKVTAYGPSLRVYLDNRLVLRGHDASLPGPGSIGLMARGNNAARFYSVDLVQA